LFILSSTRGWLIVSGMYKTLNAHERVLYRICLARLFVLVRFDREFHSY